MLFTLCLLLCILLPNFHFPKHWWLGELHHKSQLSAFWLSRCFRKCKYIKFSFKNELDYISLLFLLITTSLYCPPHPIIIAVFCGLVQKLYFCGSAVMSRINAVINRIICFSAPRGRRGWKKFYAVLKGTILYLQKVCLTL